MNQQNSENSEEKNSTNEEMSDGPKFAPNSKITLNVGGKIFASTYETLTSQPGTFFYGLLKHGQPNEDGEYFIDRDYKFFDIILNHMRGIGILNIINDIQKHDMELFYEEVLFYCISDLSVVISKMLNSWGLGIDSYPSQAVDLFRWFACHKNGSLRCLGVNASFGTTWCYGKEDMGISAQSLHDGSEEILNIGSKNFCVGKHFWRVTANMLPEFIQKANPPPHLTGRIFADEAYHTMDEFFKCANVNTLPLIQGDLMHGGTMAIGVYDAVNNIMYGIKDPKRDTQIPEQKQNKFEGECKVYNDGVRIPLSKTKFVEMEGCYRTSSGDEKSLQEVSWKKGDVFDVTLDCGTGCLSISSPTNGLECSISGLQFKYLRPAFRIGYLEEAKIEIIHH